MFVHAIKTVGWNFVVSPPDVPVSSPMVMLDHPSKGFSDLLDNGVLGIADIDDYFFGFEAFAELHDGNASEDWE